MKLWLVDLLPYDCHMKHWLADISLWNTSLMMDYPYTVNTGWLKNWPLKHWLTYGRLVDLSVALGIALWIIGILIDCSMKNWVTDRLWYETPIDWWIGGCAGSTWGRCWRLWRRRTGRRRESGATWITGAKYRLSLRQLKTQYPRSNQLIIPLVIRTEKLFLSGMF